MKMKLTVAGWMFSNVAGDAPATFDCGMRQLAYKYGRSLLPRQGNFSTLYYALNLNDPGCLTPMETAYAPDAIATIPSGAIFVDASKGRDTNVGSEAAPLQSIASALKKAPTGTIVLRDGTFYLQESLLLTAENSGVTIMAYPHEKPIVSGGKKVDVMWELYNVAPSSGELDVLDSTNVVTAGTVDELQNTRMNIYKTDLNKQVSEVPGLQVNGERATRARYPNLPGGLEVSPMYGGMISGGSAAWTPPDFHKYPPVKYHTDNVSEHTRNDFPPDSFQHYMIGIGGLCSVYDPPVGFWCSEDPHGGGAFAFRTPSGVTPKEGALPNAPYKDVSEMIINVWHPYRWANWMFKVGDYNTSTGNFTFGEGGNQGARGENVGGDFFVENIMEELDHPGEFFHDTHTDELYLYYNGTGAPPSDMEVVIPQLRVLVNASGSQWNPIRNVTIEGITFKSTRYTYMDPHGVPSGGDWALDRTGAIFLEGTESFTVSSSTFERLDGNGVMISGYNRYASVQDSDFAFIGGNAMVSWGYTNETENSGFPYYRPQTNYPAAGVDGTDGNHPRYNQILRNNAREVGLYEKQSSFYMQAKTAQSTIQGNVFFNGPRAGINFNDGFGGGDDLNTNLVFSACRESGDHGPFNSWDRQPYLTTVNDGTPSMRMAWRELHHNFFLDNYSPQEGVDNDDGSYHFHTHHNFLVYGQHGMKTGCPGGHDNHHFGNVYAYIGQIVYVCPTLEGQEHEFYSNKVVMTGNQVGSVGYPSVKLHDNAYFTPDGTVNENGESLADAQKNGLDIGSTAAKLPSDGTVLGWASDLLSISHDQITI